MVPWHGSTVTPSMSRTDGTPSASAGPSLYETRHPVACRGLFPAGSCANSPRVAVVWPASLRFRGAILFDVSDPCFSVEKLPGSGVLVALSSRAGGRSRRRHGRPMIPAGRLTGPARGGSRRRPATSPAAARFSLRAKVSSDSSRTPLTTSLARSTALGSRWACAAPKAGLLRPRDAGGDHDAAPLRRERTGAGVRGRRPRPPGATAAARDAGGSKGGAASPRPPQCGYIG